MHRLVCVHAHMHMATQLHTDRPGLDVHLLSRLNMHIQRKMRANRRANMHTKATATDADADAATDTDTDLSYTQTHRHTYTQTCKHASTDHPDNRPCPYPYTPILGTQ